MNAPQIIMICLMAMQLTAAICKHGQPKNQTFNGPVTLLDVMVTTGLLYWGGFFSQN